MAGDGESRHDDRRRHLHHGTREGACLLRKSLPLQLPPPVLSRCIASSPSRVACTPRSERHRVSLSCLHSLCVQGCVTQTDMCRVIYEHFIGDNLPTKGQVKDLMKKHTRLFVCCCLLYCLLPLCLLLAFPPPPSPLLGQPRAPVPSRVSAAVNFGSQGGACVGAWRGGRAGEARPRCRCYGPCQVRSAAHALPF